MSMGMSKNGGRFRVEFVQAWRGQDGEHWCAVDVGMDVGAADAFEARARPGGWVLHRQRYASPPAGAVPCDGWVRIRDAGAADGGQGQGQGRVLAVARYRTPRVVTARDDTTVTRLAQGVALVRPGADEGGRDWGARLAARPDFLAMPATLDVTCANEAWPDCRARIEMRRVVPDNAFANMEDETRELFCYAVTGVRIWVPGA